MADGRPGDGPEVIAPVYDDVPVRIIQDGEKFSLDNRCNFLPIFFRHFLPLFLALEGLLLTLALHVLRLSELLRSPDDIRPLFWEGLIFLTPQALF